MPTSRPTSTKTRKGADRAPREQLRVIARSQGKSARAGSAGMAAALAPTGTREKSKFLQGDVTKQGVSIETIGPEEARLLLEANTKNRHISQERVDQYVLDMRTGKWELTGDAIDISENGEISNGQHRLWAVFASEIPCQFVIFRGAKEESRLVRDMGLTRRAQDQLRLSGGLEVNSNHVAIAKAMMRGLHGADRLGKRISELKTFFDAHYKAIHFAQSAFNKNITGVTISPIKAVLARAYYTQDHERLLQFAQVMTTGMPLTADDNAAIALRSWLLTMKKSTRSVSMSQVVYGKTERALQAFMERKTLGRISGVSDELYKLPEEMTVKEKRETLVT